MLYPHCRKSTGVTISSLVLHTVTSTAVTMSSLPEKQQPKPYEKDRHHPTDQSIEQRRQAGAESTHTGSRTTSLGKISLPDGVGRSRGICCRLGSLRLRSRRYLLHNGALIFLVRTAAFPAFETALGARGTALGARGTTSRARGTT